MESLSQLFGPVLGAVIALVWGLLTILAVLEIFFIGSTLKKLLEAVKKADARRREEFDAMTEAGQ